MINIPLHVSGIWIPHYEEDPLRTGSVGAGLNISIKAMAKYRLGECRIYFNEETEVFRHVALDLCKETGINVETIVTSPARLGSGFGLSAGLIIAHSLFTHLLSGKGSLRALQKAHYHEVTNRTGLGDVLAIYTGGFAVRVKAGAPGVGYAYRIIPRHRVQLIVIELEQSESTPSMLSRLTSEIMSMGMRLLDRVIETEDISIFFESSRIYTSSLFDYTLAKQVANRIPGIVDYYLKKSALVIWVEHDHLEDAIETARSMNLKAYPATISDMGVSVDYSTKSP